MDWFRKHRVRLLIRGAFAFLALAIVALSFGTMQWLKQRSYANYHQGLQNRLNQFEQQLRHPTGQLALLNPELPDDGNGSVRAYLMQYGGLSIGNPRKARDEADIAGCLVQYGSSSLCAGVSTDKTTGAYAYLSGAFLSKELVSQPGKEVQEAHRIELLVEARDISQRWVAPFQYAPPPRPASKQLTADPTRRLMHITGYRLDGRAAPQKDDKEFKGFVSQERSCRTLTPAEKSELGTDDGSCWMENFFALRVPVDAFRRDAMDADAAWPPPDLASAKLTIRILAPRGSEREVLFDSRVTKGKKPFVLRDLVRSLLPGEQLVIEGKEKAPAQPVVLSGPEVVGVDALGWLIRQLPVAEDLLSDAREVPTKQGMFSVALYGRSDGVDAGLASIAAKVQAVVIAMLLAIVLAWLAIEIYIVRRVSKLTARAAALSRTIRSEATGDHIEGDLTSLKGPDELGVLASGLDDLLRKVNDDISREMIRLDRDRRNWEAIGHEILNPLANLQALHVSSDDPSKEHVDRMSGAIRTIYGSASPSDAMDNAELSAEVFDLVTFLKKVSRNAPVIGIPNVAFVGSEQEALVKADRGKLADAVEHILSNANRYRNPGSTVVIQLDGTETGLTVHLTNLGPPIPEDLVDRIFEYGVSDSGGGLGLFVAQSYLNKMDGSITVRNDLHGVTFSISIPRLTPAQAPVGRNIEEESEFRSIDRLMASTPVPQSPDAAPKFDSSDRPSESPRIQ